MKQKCDCGKCSACYWQKVKEKFFVYCTYYQSECNVNNTCADEYPTVCHNCTSQRRFLLSSEVKE